jgi:hypothetical protein
MPDFEVFNNALFTGGPDTQHYTQSYLLTLSGTSITWISDKQTTVTTSISKAELLRLIYYAKTNVATLRLFRNINFKFNETLII